MAVTVKLTIGHFEAAACALSQAGRFGMAADFFRYAIGASSSPDPCLWTGLCGVLRLSKQYPEAESAILEALSLERTAQRLVALACTQRDRGRKPEAEATLREALELDPDYADALGFLGTWLIDRWRETSGPDEILMEALMYLDKAVELAPNNESFQEARLIVIQNLDLHEECLANCERLLEHHPRALSYETQRAFALMKLRDLPRGLRALADNIYRRPVLNECPVFRYPRWQPGDPPGDVVLWNPEGSGDWFQFARYFRLAAEAGATLRVIANPPEDRLLARVAGVAEILKPDDVEIERHATIYSLAAQFTGSEADIPTEPYLSAPHELVELWRQRLDPIPGFRVGVAWKGNPKQDNDPRRSFTVDRFQEMVVIPGVQLICLQHGHRDELADSHIWDLGDYYEQGDWLDTAAVVANLDLVICPCTGVAHLAGGMGKPVWVALSEPGCWRWATKREDTPWYPSMRIFRQTTRGSWDGVFERITEALSRRAGMPAPAPEPVPVLSLRRPERPLELIPPRRPAPHRRHHLAAKVS